MSFAAFYAGLSGLQTNSNRLSVIGNNLANLNTVGFKTSRVTFEDVFASASGSGVNGAGNPQQVGLGVQIAGIQQIFSQGSMQTTGLVSDVAVQGNGFFVLEDSLGGQRLTRAGNFTFDKDGSLVNSAGHFVQGFTSLDANGNIIASGGVTNIEIPKGLTAPPQATTFFAAALNLNPGATVDDLATLPPADEAEEFSNSLTIFDSLGDKHVLTLTFRPEDTDADGKLDEWSFTVTAEGDEVTGGTPGTPFAVAIPGTVTFDGNGNLVTPAGNIAITIPGWTNSANPQTIDWQLYDNDGNGLITGFAGESAPASTNQDGFAVGQLRALTIDQDGLIGGIFTNGATLELARLALATFNNDNGLLKSGQNTLLETTGSGAATIGAANSGGRGLIRSNSLELSNVDITQEFTDLIITERGYQANSRIITTTDAVIQEALSLKR